MHIRFTNHCEERITERGLNKEQIISTLLNPDYKESTFGGRIKVRRFDETQELEVIYVRQERSLVVITAYIIYGN